MVGGEKKFHQQTTLPSFAELKEKDIPIPDMIGPYKIETLLAQGSTSLIYLGLDPKTREARVVKALSPEYVNHPEMADHFLWEARVIALADHPNIVKLHEYGKWEGGMYIGMEFIRGVSLRQFLIQKSFSLKRCLDLVLQISYALCHLHTHGVIHRDLKPENILIADDGEIKVIDFGIAQLHEDEEQPHLKHKIVGTPNYMSPEQKENHQNVTFSSDIYSLGIIAYELITGKLSHGMINLSLLPSGLQPIIGKALAISQKERYQDIVPFITDLTDYYKSPIIEKDRPGEDQMIELIEVINRTERTLSTLQKPKWPQFEIGIAVQDDPNAYGLYLDFFQFANNTKAIVLAHPAASYITSPIHTAHLRGIIKTLLDPYIRTEKALDLAAFAIDLNTLIANDTLNETYHLHILKLIPQTDTLLFLSCGPGGPLFHIPRGKNVPRTIISDNPLLGQDLGATFNISGDTLEDNDRIILHPFPQATYEDALHKTIAKNALLSPNRMAQSILQAVYDYPFPKAAIALTRLS